MFLSVTMLKSNPSMVDASFSCTLLTYLRKSVAMAMECIFDAFLSCYVTTRENNDWSEVSTP